MDAEIKEIVQVMDDIINDTSVPRNIRRAVADAKELVLKKEGDPVVNITEAIYILDEASNDINMPMHTRTQVWQIMGALESYREKIKG
ncbi:MAG: uncharacterized protein PWP76_615 [Candidatus Diapherotrites archaeon]|nr:uncharacterized protein [Candidatus Diapherotrites archaeon]